MSHGLRPVEACLPDFFVIWVYREELAKARIQQHLWELGRSSVKSHAAPEALQRPPKRPVNFGVLPSQARRCN